jgi:predicted nucleic acid-binding Zn ribbon protein
VTIVTTWFWLPFVGWEYGIRRRIAIDRRGLRVTLWWRTRTIRWRDLVTVAIAPNPHVERDDDCRLWFTSDQGRW